MFESFDENESRLQYGLATGGRLGEGRVAVKWLRGEPPGTLGTWSLLS